MKGVRHIQKKGVHVGKTILRRSLANPQKKSLSLVSKRKSSRKNTPKKITKNMLSNKVKRSKIFRDPKAVRRLKGKDEHKENALKNNASIISQEQFSLIPKQILREDGTTSGTFSLLSSEQIKSLYRFMILSRAFDDAALKLQRQGRLGTYGSVRGQEASQVGSAFALQKEDWLVPSFRENASCITRGMPMKGLFQYWGGDERGHAYTESMTTLPLSIPIATQLLHGVGLAMALSYKGQKNAVLAHVGDGGTSEGDFHEALNFAGVFKAPVVFLVQNNQWAIYTL